MELGDIIAQNIKRIIEATPGATEVGVAKAAGLNHTAVRDIVNRKSKNPSYLNLMKIAKVLDVDISAIVGSQVLMSLTDEEREMLYLMSELSQEQRDFLLKSARGVAVQRDRK